ncbi:hypothetical protein OIU78_010396 [Salix suchowensis]|nr:hypothetical protein OIU78_010396 [Salix suchowensis]
MLCDSFITAVTSTTATAMPPAAAASHVFPIRYDHDQHLRWRRRNGTSIVSVSVSASASPFSINQMNMDSSSRRLKTYQEAVKSAREKFTQEISFQSKDKDISLAKALLYIAAEDEAFISYNREMDACSLLKERRDVSAALNSQEWDCVEQMPLAGKSTSQWVSELDNIAKDVEAELVSRDIGCHLVELLDAVNLVLFELRGFKRSPVVVDSKYSYLHTVLSTRCGSAILLSIIYIEVCRRLGLTIVGSRVGEDFLIWPQTGEPRGALQATKRDIIGIALANLIRLHWKRASRSNPGLMLTSPLRRAHNTDEKLNRIHNSSIPLLRPQDLRLAIMASERLLILQPHNWALRRDHGMMLYYNRKYGQAVQELSICMAFAPEEEAEFLELSARQNLDPLIECCQTAFGVMASVCHLVFVDYFRS